MRRQIRGRTEPQGFTLLELLVTLIIISILAAIAIPVFFRQRDKGLVAQSQSALANAKLMAESYYVGDGDGSYDSLDSDSPILPTDGTVSILENEGLKFADGISLVVGSSPSEYCIVAVHAGLPSTNAWQRATIHNVSGRPSELDDCPA